MITKTQLSRLGLFDAKVPRYTSYPTAVHFNGDVAASDFERWITALPENGTVSLYIHVPFCRRLCWFCACRTQGTATASPVDAYVDTLLAELELLRTVLPKGTKLSRMHWGGGTPTLLTPFTMQKLADAIQDVAPFAESYEFSVEIDPNEIDDARLDALKAAGMNRASVGIQDFDDAIQQTIGREQSFDQTKRAIDMIRDCGITSLNADILYGLPHQTPQKITASMQKLVSLTPDRVALYGYAHVPWMAKRQKLIPEDALPSAEERLKLFEIAQRVLNWDGYEEIGIDHFATQSDGLTVAKRQGTLRRNFQGYTDDTSPALIGLGASSISKFPQGYAQNAPATAAYNGAIREGRFATTKGHIFRGRDLLRARMIEMLMCDFRIDGAELMREFDVSQAFLHDAFATANAAFEGLLVQTRTSLAIPADARPLTRIIAGQMDSYQVSARSHSSAI